MYSSQHIKLYSNGACSEQLHNVHMFIISWHLQGGSDGAGWRNCGRLDRGERRREGWRRVGRRHLIRNLQVQKTPESLYLSNYFIASIDRLKHRFHATVQNVRARPPAMPAVTQDNKSWGHVCTVYTLTYFLTWLWLTVDFIFGTLISLAEQHARALWVSRKRLWKHRI